MVRHTSNSTSTKSGQATLYSRSRYKTIYTRLGILLILPLPNQVRHTSNSTSTKSGQATLKKYKTIYSWLGILLILPLPNQDRQHYKSKKLPCSQQQVILHHFTVSLEEGQVLATDKQDTIQIPFRYHLDTFQIPFRYLFVKFNSVFVTWPAGVTEYCSQDSRTRSNLTGCKEKTF